MAVFQGIDSSPPVTTNALFDLGSAQKSALDAQAAQNQLNDAQTARDLAPAIAQGDRTATAIATAADPARGISAVNGLIASDAATRQQASYDVQSSASLANSVLNLPADQRPAAWAAGVNQLRAEGHQYLPSATYPGDTQLITGRAAALTVGQQLDHQGGFLQFSDPLLSPRGGGSVGPQAAPVPGSAPTAGGGSDAPTSFSYAPGPKTEQGQFSDALAQSESGGNPQAVNAGGYAGAFQYGTGRLADLGFYQPSQGEAGNQWSGQFTIPGFPQVKTLQDFLANPQAQQAVRGADTADTMRVIANTPGADKMNTAGLLAVAHLGGVTGMQRFAVSGGRYNPADANGTTLMDYYQKFSAPGSPQFGPNPYTPNGMSQAQTAAQQQGGQPAQTASTAPSFAPAPGSGYTGQPAGASGPVYAPTPAPNGSAPPLLAAASGSALGQPPTGQPAPSVPASLHTDTTPGAVQTASLEGTRGLPPTAMDAGSGPNPVYPTGQPAQDAGAPVATAAAPVRVPSTASAPASVATGGPANGAVSRPNALFAPAPAGASGNSLPAAVPNALSGFGQGAPAAPNSLAGVAPGISVTPSAPGTPPVGPTLPPGVVAGSVGGRPGLYWAGSGIPYSPPVTKIENGILIQQDPVTGRLLGPPQRVADTRPPMHVTDQTGVEHVYDQDHNEIATIGTPTYKPDMDQWHADQKDVQQASDELQSDQEQALKLGQQRQLLATGLATGAGGNMRAQLAAYFDTLVGPGKSADLVNQVLTGSPNGAAQAQIFNKLSLVNAGQQERENLGARGGYQATKLYLAANPSMELLPDANKDINNLQLVSNQASQDYLQGLQDWVNTKGDAFVSSAGKTRYQSSNLFDQQWQAQRNPQVYAAATGALNGQPFSQWSKGLQPDEITRAAGIVGRVDPNATFNGPQGVVRAAGPQQPASGAPSPGTPNPPQPISALPVQSRAEFDALPSGATFIAPDGSLRQKP